MNAPAVNFRAGSRKAGMSEMRKYTFLIDELLRTRKEGVTHAEVLLEAFKRGMTYFPSDFSERLSQAATEEEQLNLLQLEIKATEGKVFNAYRSVKKAKCALRKRLVEKGLDFNECRDAKRRSYQYPVIC